MTMKAISIVEKTNLLADLQLKLEKAQRKHHKLFARLPNTLSDDTVNLAAKIVSSIVTIASTHAKIEIVQSQKTI